MQVPERHHPIRRSTHSLFVVSLTWLIRVNALASPTSQLLLSPTNRCRQWPDMSESFDWGQPKEKDFLFTLHPALVAVAEHLCCASAVEVSSVGSMCVLLLYSLSCHDGWASQTSQKYSIMYFCLIVGKERELASTATPTRLLLASLLSMQRF